MRDGSALTKEERVEAIKVIEVADSSKSFMSDEADGFVTDTDERNYRRGWDEEPWASDISYASSLGSSSSPSMPNSPSSEEGELLSDAPCTPVDQISGIPTSPPPLKRSNNHRDYEERSGLDRCELLVTDEEELEARPRTLENDVYTLPALSSLRSSHGIFSLPSRARRVSERGSDDDDKLNDNFPSKRSSPFSP